MRSFSKLDVLCLDSEDGVETTWALYISAANRTYAKVRGKYPLRGGSQCKCFVLRERPGPGLESLQTDVPVDQALLDLDMNKSKMGKKDR